MTTPMGKATCYHTWSVDIWANIDPPGEVVELRCKRCDFVGYSLNINDAEELIAHLLNIATDFAPGTLATYLAPHGVH